MSVDRSKLSPDAQHLGLDEELPKEELTILTEEDVQAQERAAAAAERPDWLDPRYDSPEDQAKAYKQAERAMHEANQRAKAMEDRIAHLEANFQRPEPQQSEEWDPTQQVLERGDYEAQLDYLARENPLQAMRMLMAEQQQANLEFMQEQARIAQYREQQMRPMQEARENTQSQLVADAAYERVVARNPDYDDYHERVVELVNDPEWISAEDAWDLGKLERAVERAYRVAKAERITSTDEELMAQGLSQAEIERQRKMQAQSLRPAAQSREAEMTPDERVLAGILNSAEADGSYASQRRVIWGDLRGPQ